MRNLRPDFDRCNAEISRCLTEIDTDGGALLGLRDWSRERRMIQQKMPRALDLYCCAGGATRGLQRAGFHVTGIDIQRQPRYCGDAFIQGDALRPPVDLRRFDFIWASPPCQAFTPLRALQGGKEYPNLIPQTRAMLIAAGVPFSIENVENAPLGETGNLILLCGTMFRLQTSDGRAELRRHRLFETSFSIPLRPRCAHGLETLSVTGTGMDSNRNRWRRQRTEAVISIRGDHARNRQRRRAISVTGSTAQTNTDRNRDRETFSVEQAREAMGIDWMTMKGLSQAIPPAYSEFIAREFLAWRASQLEASTPVELEAATR